MQTAQGKLKGDSEFSSESVQEPTGPSGSLSGSISVGLLRPDDCRT